MIKSITPLPEYIKLYAVYKGDTPDEDFSCRALFVGIEEDGEGFQYPVLYGVYDGMIENLESAANFEKYCYETELSTIFPPKFMFACDYEEYEKEK